MIKNDYNPFNEMLMLCYINMIVDGRGSPFWVFLKDAQIPLGGPLPARVSEGFHL
jgi:hypothetical protein